MPKKPPADWPVVDAIAADGNHTYELLRLVFRLHGKPVELWLDHLHARRLVELLAQGMASGPPSLRSASQVFAPRTRPVVSLEGRIPTIRHELESGIGWTGTIDVADLRALVAEATQVLEHLDSLGSSPVQ